jgi:hypothetical protein
MPNRVVRYGWTLVYMTASPPIRGVGLSKESLTLGRLVLAVMNVGNGTGRVPYPEVGEVARRLREDADTDITDSELADIVGRLVDCGQLVRIQKQAGYPAHLAHAGRHPFDHLDVLMSDVCAVLRLHDETFTSLEQLRGWLEAAGVDCEQDQLYRAVDALFRLNRLQRPREDRWASYEPRPVWLVNPRVLPDTAVTGGLDAFNGPASRPEASGSEEMGWQRRPAGP